MSSSVTPHGSSDDEDRQNSPVVRGPSSVSSPSSVEAGSWGEEDLDLWSLFAVIRRRWIFVAFCTVVGVSLAVVSLRFAVDRYQSSAAIRIADARQMLTGTLDPAAQQVLGRRADPLQSQMEVLRSSAVLGEVVDSEGLRFVPVTRGLHLGHFEAVEATQLLNTDSLSFLFDQVGFSLRSGENSEHYNYAEEVILPGLRFIVPERPPVGEGVVLLIPRQSAIQALRASLTVRLRSETDVVDVTFTAPDPEVAEKITNSVVRTFRDYNVRLARQEAERRRAFVEERLSQADSVLAVAQSTLSDFRGREGVFSSQEWFVAQQAELLNLEIRREELDASRSMYRDILDGLGDAGMDDLSGRLQAIVASPEVAQNPVVSELFTRLSFYEIQYDSMTTGPWRASANNPDVVRLEEQIVSTTANLETAIRGHLRQLDAQVVSLDDMLGRTQQDISALPTVEAEEARLVQQVESIRRTVDQLSEEYQRALITEAVEVGQVEIMDAAPLPLEPLGQRAPLRLMLGLIVGFAFGSGVAFLRENLNTKIRRREDLETLLRVPSVGVVPRLPGTGAAFLQTGSIGKVRGLLGGRSPDGPRKVGQGLVTISDARSPQAEAYRTIRTNLLYSEAVPHLRTLVVTSSTPSEGKSTTASNLAIAYAQQGMRVLLIDCDLRKARLHQLFGLPRQPGLTELVLGKVEWEAVVHDGPTEGLQVVPSGAHPPNPAELVGGARMRKALDLFREHFDLVILDTPPLIAGPDAAILGSYCDGVVLVVRAGQTEREAGQQAVRQLHTVGARILGAILNDPDGELPRYSSYYAYQYKYYYGSDEKD